MDRRRHTLALTSLAAASALALLGCFDSHGTGVSADPDPRPTPPPAIDAGFMGPTDAGGPAVIDPPVACRGPADARSVRVELEALGSRPCEYGEHSEVALYSAGPVEDGVELLYDACPYSDEDCRCRATVTGVGADAVPETPPGFVSVSTAPSGIVFETPCEAECVEPCDCIADLTFAAVDGMLEAPPVAAEGVTASWGEELCVTMEGGCDHALAQLELITWASGFPGAIGTPHALEQGQTVADDGGALTLRVLASSYPICGEELPRNAAWVAWR